jgi:hypothetical protein
VKINTLNSLSLIPHVIGEITVRARPNYFSALLKQPPEDEPLAVVAALYGIVLLVIFIAMSTRKSNYKTDDAPAPRSQNTLATKAIDLFFAVFFQAIKITFRALRYFLRQVFRFRLR